MTKQFAGRRFELNLAHNAQQKYITKRKHILKLCIYNTKDE